MFKLVGLLFVAAAFGCFVAWNQGGMKKSWPRSSDDTSSRLVSARTQPLSSATNERGEERVRLAFDIAAIQEEKGRVAMWRTDFPWKPTTDPDVVFDPKLHRPGYAHPVTTNHGFLKAFFENEARFTAQFEQLYQILASYDRADNPVVVGASFQNLWDYHQALKEDPESLLRQGNGRPVIDRRTGQTITMAQEVRALKDSILYNVHAEREWPDKIALTAEVAEELRDRIVEEIAGMDTLPNPRFYRMGDYERELKPGDMPLVPKVGWQAAYDEWDRVSELDLQMRIQEDDPILKKNFPELFESSPVSDAASPIRIGPNNELLGTDGEPLRPKEESGFFGSLVTPEGEQVPLQRSDDGRILIPTPDEIAVMRAKGEIIPAEP